MRFLRSTFLGVIVSLLLFAGYANDLAGVCCGHAEEHEQTDHGATGNSGDCQCICHQVISPCTVDLVSVVAISVKPSGFLPHADEFPPEALPLGIDYPPQLA